MQNFTLNRYAGLHCNDVDIRIKSLMITKRFPNFQMSPDFDLSLATDSNHPISGIAQVDYCGGEQQLFYISISEDDKE